MEKQALKIAFRSAIYSLGLVIVYFLANALLSGRVWNGMVISKSAMVVEYCEFNNVDRFFHQSMNTYSNIVYFFFGLIICQLAWIDQKNSARVEQNRLEQFPALSFLMGISFIYLSIGSAFFHASLTWVGQRMDMNGTYSLTFSLLCICLYHVFYKLRLSDRAKSRFPFVAIFIILLLYQFAMYIPSSLLLPAFILSIWLLTAINYIQFRKDRSVYWAIASIILIIVAFKIRQLDVQKINCDPYSLCQGHSVWHVLAALSSFCGYAFFRFTSVSRLSA